MKLSRNKRVFVLASGVAIVMALSLTAFEIVGHVKPSLFNGFISSGPLAKFSPVAPGVVVGGRIDACAEAFKKVWNDASGRSGEMPTSALVLALAQAGAEHTGYGQGWEMKGNIASYQCGGDQKGTAFYDCIEHEDSRPDPNGGPNQKYTTTFRSYKDGPGPDGKTRTALENGAYDFLKAITVKPFPAVSELLSGDLLAYCKKQESQHYFEGFNLSPAGLEAYRHSVNDLIRSGLIPRRSGDTEERLAGRICFYAASMARNIPEIMFAIGVEKSGVIANADLLQPWKPAFQAS